MLLLITDKCISVWNTKFHNYNIRGKDDLFNDPRWWLWIRGRGGTLNFFKRMIFSLLWYPSLNIPVYQWGHLVSYFGVCSIRIIICVVCIGLLLLLLALFHQFPGKAKSVFKWNQNSWLQQKHQSCGCDLHFIPLQVLEIVKYQIMTSKLVTKYR